MAVPPWGLYGLHWLENYEWQARTNLEEIVLGKFTSLFTVGVRVSRTICPPEIASVCLQKKFLVWFYTPVKVDKKLRKDVLPSGDRELAVDIAHGYGAESCCLPVSVSSLSLLPNTFSDNSYVKAHLCAKLPF